MINTKQIRGQYYLPDGHTFVINVGDEATEVAKLGDYKLILESLGNNLEVLFHNPVEVEEWFIV